eukprot:gnl/Chilomastix_cuspidata/2555.p2 GENE.gnl/Chilomastix_cuspidata/2555~~gnl/Chilomastix_cuspidata/2555.p2  ORF type:complete len:500 (+),score=244.62 gnl/Chilomastix_cuspidata/2555:35-1501(+)
MAARLRGVDVSAIVLDTGTTTLKAGFAGNTLPSMYIPSSVGYVPGVRDAQNVAHKRESISEAAAHAGEEPSAPAPRRRLDLDGIRSFEEHKEIRRAVRGGLVSDYDAAEDLWSYTLGKLRQPSHVAEDLPVLLSEPIFNQLANRQKTAEILFEKLGVPAVSFFKSATLSCVAAARHTGLVVEAGGGYTAAVPVVEGYAIKRRSIYSSRLCGELAEDALSSFLRFRRAEALALGGESAPLIPHAGGAGPGSGDYTFLGSTVKLEHAHVHPTYMFSYDRDRTAHVRTLMHVRPSYARCMEQLLARDAFQEACYVSESPVSLSGIEPVASHKLTLPDGTDIGLAQERTLVPEIYFNPAHVKAVPWLEPSPSLAPLASGDETITRSVQAMAHEAIAPLQDVARKELLGAVIPSGGVANLRGFHQRLRLEFETIEPLSYRLRVISTSTPGSSHAFLPWVGGSVLSSISLFVPMWISREEFREHGPAIISARCQ